MKPKPGWLRPPWFAVNIVLFSKYAVFEAASFFWPRMVHSWWIIVMYSATVFINCLIARIPRINYLVVLTSLLMAVYLAIFITSPLGLSFAYLGPSRSFYSLFIIVMSLIAGEGAVGTLILVFNIAMACVHVINVVYFSRRSVAALFTIREDGMVAAA
jgi:hypothetical protein